jgi:2-polyprenyl-3-methyl-5-hydroxy-6-metoxy-1,4-benzoquinol methylase
MKTGESNSTKPMDLESHFDWVAENDQRARKNQYAFHNEIRKLIQYHVEPGRTVMEWGCGAGDLLAALKPSRGVGYDLSERMLAKARQRYPQDHLEFRKGHLEEDIPEEGFDVIILDYLTGYLSDIQQALENLRESAHADTRLYLTSLNTLWRPILALSQPLGLVMKQPPSNWLSKSDLINLLELAGWEVVLKSSEVMFPFGIPGLRGFFNRFLVRLPFFQHFGSTLFLVARPMKKPVFTGAISCSVVVPARNEAGNIKAALERIPTLGKQTEVIFVEGNSADDTWEVIQKECAAYKGPHQVQYCQQPGKGKWDAVYTGFSKANGDVLVIQDGDLTAPPEDLPKFYKVVEEGLAEFANGCRLVYPMESNAMRFLNLLGNKFFALALSAVLRQPVKDSLCGTKMITRKNYDRLLVRIEDFGDFDPFGDFNLLFGSAYMDLKIRDIPVRYRDRTYGDTNISRFKHGWILLKMTWFGLRKLRFS